MKSITNIYTLAFLLTSSFLASCDNYLDTGAPINQVGPSEAFQDEFAANSSVAALYNTNNFNSPSQGNIENSVIGAFTVLLGMSSDEIYRQISSPSLDQFSQNNLLTDNSANNNLWNFTYKHIAYINAAIEGLQASTGIAAERKNVFLGECYALRAFDYFYLMNLYGDIPLILTTLPEEANKGRNAVTEVLSQINTDLESAKQLLTDTYPDGNPLRIRINRDAVEALQAKILLHQERWAEAEATATEIIGDSKFQLENDLSKVFVNDSPEVIWQLFTFFGYNQFGRVFAASDVPEYVLYDSFADMFEDGDARLEHWLKVGQVGGTDYLYPYKYKNNANTASGNEYIVMFRLAEQYLIRAEARAQQNRLYGGGGAVEDLNRIRERANLLPLDQGLSREQVLQAIYDERARELFAESGQRWLDLKRTGKATEVLAPIKENWTPTAELFPIPNQQRILNGNLTQNNGYDD